MEYQWGVRATMAGGPASGQSILLMEHVQTIFFPVLTDKGVIRARYRLDGVPRDGGLCTYVFDGIEPAGIGLATAEGAEP